MLNITELDDAIRLEIRVQPRSSRNQVSGEMEGILKLKLTAPPVEGLANKALVEYLSSLLGISKKNIILRRGESSRSKLIEIKGINKREFLNKIGF